jgi:anaerobic selenocysteine-containing dehydrogenase
MAQTVRTMCPMNCHPTLCGMLVDVEAGAVQAVRGDPANPDSAGFLCVRGRAAPEIFTAAGRLLHPLVRDRRTDDFRRASWDEALDRIAASLSASAPGATALWPGHGVLTTNYGTRIAPALIQRFANYHGSHYWNPTMICWGLGAFGLGLTGVLETNTKEDLGAHSRFVLLWGANLASQPNTARHVLAAQRRGARVVTIDVRHTEAAAKSDDVFLLRPGTDAALALALIHVICSEGLHDADFVAAHTVGFDALAAHVAAYTPAWAAEITGIAAERIVGLARAYARTSPAMIVLGGSSMHKGDNGWMAGRAIACLPAITGNFGKPGSGFGPRHGSAAHGRGLADLTAPDRRPAGAPAMPNQMSGVIDALAAGRIENLLLLGTNMLSSFVDGNAVAAGLARTRLVVAYDLFMTETVRRAADVVLPSTAWLEELGCKMTHTHVYLMEKALEPAGETRPLHRVLGDLAARLGLDGFHPWAGEADIIDAILDHPATGRATVRSLREAGGIAALNVSHVAYPTFRFDTPSGRIELVSARAAALGLPSLPTWLPPAAVASSEVAAHPLVLTQGRTLGHFHSFYDHGRALPTLAARERAPVLWLSTADAAARGLAEGASIRVRNDRGTMAAIVHVTDRIPAGTVWMRDGWLELNRLTDRSPVLPDHVVDLLPFPAGQANFGARVQVEAL